MYDIIAKKRDGKRLSGEEIRFVAKGAASGEIPDYQLSALLMAIYIRGLDKEETFCLTKEMCLSGEVADLSGIGGVVADKHSTGGVGDKITLVALPLAAAAGVRIAKLAGKALGHTGGTIDKLSSIPGLRTELSYGEFISYVKKSGLAISGQTGDICPADKKLYALRDVTATVDSLPLIAASVMSKKLASGAGAIVLDVKAGSGAFMKTPEQAAHLAELMVEIAKSAGRRAAAVVSDMSQPLGYAVGNSLEVIEAIETLKSRGPHDVKALSVRIASRMAFLSGVCSDIEEAEALIEQKLASGAGLLKFRELIQNQGGNPAVLEDYSLLPRCCEKATLYAEKDGYVRSMDAEAIGVCALRCGAGRRTKEQDIDYGAGVIVHKKIGDSVRKGEILATAYFNGKDKGVILAALKKGYDIGPEKPEIPPVVYKIIE